MARPRGQKIPAARQEAERAEHQRERAKQPGVRNDVSMPKYVGSVNNMMFIANAVHRPMRLARSRLSGGAATSGPGGPRK